MSSTREVGQWFVSGGNGFVWLYEQGNADPVASFPATHLERSRVETIAQKHNNTLRAHEQAVRTEERERAAGIAEAMRPSGGRMWTSEQHACFEALSECATSIRRDDTAAERNDNE